FRRVLFRSQISAGTVRAFRNQCAAEPAFPASANVQNVLASACLGSAEFPAFGTLRLVCEFLKKGRRLLRSGSLIAALLPTSLPINQTPGNGDTEAGGWAKLAFVLINSRSKG